MTTNVGPFQPWPTLTPPVAAKPGPVAPKGLNPALVALWCITSAAAFLSLFLVMTPSATVAGVVSQMVWSVTLMALAGAGLLVSLLAQVIRNEARKMSGR